MAPGDLKKRRNNGLTRLRCADIFNHMVKCFPRSMDRVFFALSDPTRRGILAIVAGGEPKVTSLAEPFAISLVAISKHIRVLEQAGLLKRTKHGREYHLRLVAEPLKDVSGWARQFERFWDEHLTDIKSRAEQKARAKSQGTKP